MTSRKPFIKPLELITLTLGSAIMFPYTFLPILNSSPKNSDVWVALVLALFLIVIINLPLLYIIKKFRGLNINQIFDAIAGKIAGKIALVFYFAFFFLCFFVCMMLSIQFIQTSIMIKTPAWALVLTAIIPATYAASKGPGVVARLSVFVVPLILLTVIIFAISGAEFYQIDHILPICADSYFLDILKGALSTAFRFSEVVIVLVFSYFLKQGTSAIKVYFINIILFGAFFLLILLPVLLTFGYTLASRAFNPYFLFARQVQLFNMIEKVQSINTLVWFPGTILKMSIYNCMAAFILSNMIKKVKAPIISIVMSVIAFILSLIPAIENTMTIGKILSDDVMPYFMFGLILVIPLILIIVYRINKKKVDERVQKVMNDEASEQSPEEAKKHALPNNDPIAKNN
jgi:spore germination protein KB